MAGGRESSRGVTSTPVDFTIRSEEPKDAAAISEIVTAAFGSPTQARLVEAIRGSANFVPELSLVAEVDQQVVGHVVVGHVMVSHVWLHEGDTRHRVASLSPLAVAPDCQGRGIESELVRRVTARADDRGEPLVVLEGGPAFYGRLGFEHSEPLGIQIALPSWAPP